MMSNIILFYDNDILVMVINDDICQMSINDIYT